MKIAVTYENGKVFQHFGKTESFKIYEVEDNQIVSSEVISSNGSGHGALAGLLAEQGIDVLICGGIGGGAAGGQGGHHSGSGQNSNKLFHGKFSFICKTGTVVVAGADIDRSCANRSADLFYKFRLAIALSSGSCSLSPIAKNKTALAQNFSCARADKTNLWCHLACRCYGSRPLCREPTFPCSVTGAARQRILRITPFPRALREPLCRPALCPVPSPGGSL